MLSSTFDNVAHGLEIVLAGATECSLTAVKNMHLLHVRVYFGLFLPTLYNKERACKHDQRSD